MATETLSLSALRPRLSGAVDRAHEVFDRFIITRHGRAEAVLVGSDEFEGLLETLDVLSNHQLVQRLVQAEAEVDRGVTVDLETFRHSLEAPPTSKS